MIPYAYSLPQHEVQEPLKVYFIFYKFGAKFYLGAKFDLDLNICISVQK
jgi:hypothetical protein